MNMPRNRRVILPENIRKNMRALCGMVPEGVGVMAVVKADGYGHGSAPVARAALEGGASMLAVASVAEGTEIRKSGIQAPILVLGAVSRDDVDEGTESGLIQTVCSPEMVEICEKSAKEHKKQTKVHLKIDTGMGRIGVRNPAERDAVLRALAHSPHVKLTGTFTHFSDADDGPDGMEYTEHQYRIFRDMTDILDAGVLRHCANSAVIHRRPDMAMDMVRAGISLYGYPPVETGLPLKPCMRWTARISYVKEIPSGEYISYGRTFRSERPMRIATVTCGYGDGYHRCAGKAAEVLIRGKRASVVGRICMDQMMVDVTDIPDARMDDEVVLMGSSGPELITAEDLARWAGTISYEILLSAGSRVERIYDFNQEF